MTGESEALQLPGVAGPQPGGRPPAPGRLRLVQAFINTHFDLVHERGAEILRSPPALARWLAQVGLLPEGSALSGAELSRALTVREGLRRLAASPDGDDETRAAALAHLDAVAVGTRLEVRFAPHGPRFDPAPASGLDGAIGALLAITAQACADGSWSRLKICPGDHCGWAFYDQSRNRTGRWCSMSVCGARVKARRHYRRRGQES